MGQANLNLIFFLLVLLAVISKNECGDINRIKFDGARNTSSLVISRKQPWWSKLIVTLHRCCGGGGKGDVTCFWTITLIAACLLTNILAEQLGNDSGALCSLPHTLWNIMHPRYFIEVFFFLAVHLREQITSVSLSQCVWFTGHTEVLWNVNHCLGMQESPFFTKWKLSIFNPQVFSSDLSEIFPLQVYLLSEKLKSARRRWLWDLGEGLCLIAIRLWHSKTQTHQNHLHVILLRFTCHSGTGFSGWSMNAVCSCSVKAFYFFLIQNHTGKN